MSALRLELLISKTENWPWNLCMFYQNFQGELEYCGILTCVLSVYVIHWWSSGVEQDWDQWALLKRLLLGE